MDFLIKKAVAAIATLTMKVKKQTKEIGQLRGSLEKRELEITDLNKTIGTLKTLKHEYPKEVRINNFPKQKTEVKINNWNKMPMPKLQKFPKEMKISNLGDIEIPKPKESVKISNWEEMPKPKEATEAPKWLPRVLNDLIGGLATIQASVASQMMKFSGKLLGDLWEKGIDTRIVDKDGNIVDLEKLLKNLAVLGDIKFPNPGKGFSKVKLKNSSGDVINPATKEKQDSIINELQSIVGFDIPAYDYIKLTYVASGNGTGEIETVVYKTGGASGTTVGTLTLAYNASNEISSITKS